MVHRRRLRSLAGIALVTLIAGGCSTADGDPESRPAPGGPVASDPQTEDDPPRKRFHREKGQTYRFENSFRGLDYARAHDYAWIDIDANYCRADQGTGRIPIATHWSKIDTEGFDPAGLFSADTRWSDLTLSQVRGLRTNETPAYRIHTMVEMVRYAARIGLEGIEWEVKSGVAFERVATYREVLRVAREVGLQIEVKTIHGLGGKKASLARLRAAKQAGAATMLLNTDKQPVVLTRDQEAFIDYVRGTWRRA